MALAPQEVGSGKSGRTATNDGDLLACVFASFRQMERIVVGPVADVLLDGVDSERGEVVEALRLEVAESARRHAAGGIERADVHLVDH